MASELQTKLTVDDRKEMEKALRRSAEQYRTLHSNIPVGLYRNTPGPQGRFLAANPAIASMFGYSSVEEFLQANVSDLYETPEDRKAFSERLSREGKVSRVELRLKKRDGTPFWGAVSAQTIKDEHGNILHFDGMIEDISERKRMEQALRESEREYRRIFDSSPEVIGVIDGKGNLLNVNRRIFDWLGYEPEEVIGKSFHQLPFLPNGSRAIAAEKLSQTVLGEDFHEYELDFTTKNGERRVGRISASSIRCENGKLNEMLVMASDITERKRAEEELRKSEEKYRILLENLNDVVYSMDTKGNFTYISPVVEVVIGYKVDEVVGQNFARFVPPDELPRLQSIFERKLAGQLEPFEFTILDKHGILHYVRASGRLLVERGQTVGVTGIFSDITERKRMEETLRESEAKYSALVEQAKDTVVIVQDGVVKFANRAVKEVTGFEVEEVVGRPFVNWLAPESRDLLAERYKLRMAGEEVPLIYEAKIQCKDRTIKDIEISGALIKYNGTPADMGIARDISERKRMEEEIERLAKFPSENPNPVLRLSKDGVVLDANPASKPLLEDWECKLGGEAPKFWRDVVTEALTTGSDRSIDIEIGERVYAFFVKPVKDAGYVNLYGRDVTDRRKAEDALRASEERSRELAESISDVFFAMDRNLRYTYWNKASEDLTGISAEEAIGKTLYELFPDMKGTEAQRRYLETLKTRQPQHFINEYQIGGRDFFFEISAYPTKDGISVFVKDITDRKRMEEEAQKLTQFLDLVVDSANVWLDVLDEKANVVIWNKAAEKISGYSREEAARHGKIWEWLYPDEKYRKQITEKVTAIIRSGETVEDFETIIRTKSGERKIISWHSRNLVDEKGAPIGSVALGRDITEHKRIEDALRESEEKYRALVENSPDHIGIVQDGYLKYVNRTLCERSGWTFQEITSPSFNFIEKIVSKKSRDLVKKNIEKRLRGEAIPPYEITLLTRDGAEIPAIVSAQKILYQGKPADEFSLVDIAERKRMETELEKHTKHLEELVEERAKELRATKDRLQFLLSSSPAMIYTAKACGDLASTFISENFKDVLGYEPRELLEDPSFWIDHIHPEDRERMREEELRVIKDGHGAYEYRFQHKDGTYRWMREEAKLIRDAAGNPLEVIGYWIDITDLKQIEDELRQRTEDIKALNESISMRLLQKMSQIENISEVKDRLRTIPDVSTGLDLILDAASSDLGMDAGAALVIDRKDNNVKVQGFKSSKKGSELNESYLLHEGFAELEAAKQNKKISKIIGQDEPSILGTTSIHCAPIHFGKEMHGILAFGSQKDLVLDNSDLAILGLYSELASTLFETQSLTITPVKEVAEVVKKRFELEFGRTYLVKNDLEKAFQVFVDQVLSGAEGLCITREFPPKVRRNYGLEKTPIVWLTQERVEDQTTVHSLQDLSVMIGNFLQKAKRGVVLLDGFEYLITNNGFEPFIRFLQLNRSRFEQHDSIFIAPLLEEALNAKEVKLIERETKPLIAE